MKKITPLSQADIKNYLQGNLSDKEMHQVEQNLLDSELNSHALEGFEEFPDALNRIEKYKSQFKRNSPLKNKSWWQSNIITVGVVSAVLIISVVGINFYLNREVKKSEIEFSEARNESMAVLEKQELKEIEHASPIAEEEQISYRKTVESQKEIRKEQDNKEAENLVPAKINLNKVNKINLDENQTFKKEEELVKTYEKSNAPIHYLFNLKVVDYSMVYISVIPGTSRNLSGLEAKYAEKQDRVESKVQDSQTKNVPYEEFLETALKKFARNDFKSALKDFIVILKHFPEDVNAHFYGGLCYYNIGKPVKAIANFDHLLAGEINTFNQEAKWYKALSLEQKGDHKKMETLLREIIDENGFYAEKAKKKKGL